MKISTRKFISNSLFVKVPNNSFQTKKNIKFKNLKTQKLSTDSR